LSLIGQKYLWGLTVLVTASFPCPDSGRNQEQQKEYRKGNRGNFEAQLLKGRATGRGKEQILATRPNPLQKNPKQ